MGTVKINRIFPGLLMGMIFWSCNGPIDDPVPVESIFTVLPESGLTTTRFEFNASQTFIPADENHPILIRYDWQNDGIWDQEYTTSAKIRHRYLKPGTYTIRMEARNMLGLRDTSTATIMVEQGYSVPIAHLAILPDSANIYTVFSFSAAKSYDDEDSSNLLTFRWDFDGDGNWETDFQPINEMLYQYPVAGKYLARLEVKDPTNRSSIANSQVTVDMLNDSILPSFRVDSGYYTVTDIIQFNASASKFLDRDDKKLTYSWDIFNDNLWEAVDLETPFFKRVIKQEGMIRVKLRVTDDRGLYMDTTKKMEIFPENTPPKVVFVVGSRVGNLQTDFYFHSFGTSDRQTSIMDLKYEWDLDGDGQWDPEYTNLRELYKKYSKIGTYLVRLKVSDAHDDAVIKSDTVFVNAGTHETGLLKDKRNFIPDYYGIVKIGNLWWMQENLYYKREPTKDNPGIIPLCYRGDTAWCERYGGLYHYSVTSYICPFGWRLPTKAEFQDMVSREAPGSLVPLLSGGSSELYFLTGGYIDMAGRSLGFGSVTHFWLNDRSAYGIPGAWYVDKSKGENRPVVSSEKYGYSVRCVKTD